MLWENQWQKTLVCNSSKTVFCLDPQTGETIWEGPGGGASTPASAGNYLVVHGKTEDVGLICYEADKDKISERWRFPKLTRRTDSSPLIFDQKAILFGAGMRLCIDLKVEKFCEKYPPSMTFRRPSLLVAKYWPMR